MATIFGRRVIDIDGRNLGARQGVPASAVHETVLRAQTRPDPVEDARGQRGCARMESEREREARAMKYWVKGDWKITRQNADRAMYNGNDVIPGS